MSAEVTYEYSFVDQPSYRVFIKSAESYFKRGSVVRSYTVITSEDDMFLTQRHNGYGTRLIDFHYTDTRGLKSNIANGVRSLFENTNNENPPLQISYLGLQYACPRLKTGLVGAFAAEIDVNSTELTPKYPSHVWLPLDSCEIQPEDDFSNLSYQAFNKYTADFTDEL